VSNKVIARPACPDFIGSKRTNENKSLDLILNDNNSKYLYFGNKKIYYPDTIVSKRRSANKPCPDLLGD
jgi:hypothetical protein